MESSTILETYLLSRSSLDDIISFEQFKKLFPRRVSEEVIELIFQDLIKQRKIESIVRVEQRVKNEFNIPLEDVASRIDNFSGITAHKYTVEDLVSKLTTLEEVSSTQTNLLDEKISKILVELRHIIDELNDLKYSKSWTRRASENDVDNLIALAIQSIAKCETYLKDDF